MQVRSCCLVDLNLRSFTFLVAVAVVITQVNLRNRTGEKRRRQTLCDKRDNNCA